MRGTCCGVVFALPDQKKKSMDNGRWKLIAEAFGIISLVASLVFVGLEVRQSSRASLEEAFVSSNAILIDTEALVLDHPDVWLRGCMAESLEPAEKVIYSRIHHAYTFSEFFTWARATRGVSEATARIAIDNIAMNIYRYPGFRAEWEAHGLSRQHVDEEARFQIFRRLVDKRVAEYPSFEPVPLTNFSRCGLN